MRALFAMTLYGCVVAGCSDARDRVQTGVDGDGSSETTVGQCAVARIEVSEGPEVQPPVTIHLSGRSSTALSGEVVNWNWSVQQPIGSARAFSPSSTASEVAFQIDEVGEYVFVLQIADSSGNGSCEPAKFQVVAGLPDAIRVELSWHTPGDNNDQTFAPGLNLHLLHPKANGHYFDAQYDCWAGHQRPEWGTSSMSDDPSCDRGSASLKVPEQDVRYQVGVHYQYDAGSGPAYATVRVYVGGALRGEWSDVALKAGDLWSAYYVDWPSGDVTRIGDEPEITPNYRR